MMMLLAGLALAQPPERVVAAGVTLPWLSHPGLMVGARQAVGDGVWFAGIDLAGWVNPRDSLHAQATPQVGATWDRPRGRRLSTDLGVGFASESLIIGHELDLGDGRSVRSWDHQWWVVPQVSSQISWRHDQRLPMFLGLTVGQQLAPGRRGGTVFTVDLGFLLCREGS